MESSSWSGGDLPCSLRAEQAFLGALLSNSRRVWPMVEAFLRPEHFADPVHGFIFEAASRLCRDGETADAVTVSLRLESIDRLDDVGGTKYLAELVTGMVGIEIAGDYAKAVYHTWRQRELLDLAQKIKLGVRGLENAAALEEFAAVVAAEAEKIQVGQTSITANRVTAAEALDAAVRQVKQIAETRKLPGIITGLRCIDVRLAGLMPGMIYLIGGETGTGKTALAQTIVRNVTRVYDNPNDKPVRTLYCSMEMPSEQMGIRDLAAVSGISTIRMLTGNLTNDEADRLFRAQGIFKEPPLIYDDSMALTPRQIDLRVRQMKKDGGIDFLVVDHLHEMSANKEDLHLAGWERLTAIIHGLLKIARDHHIPVIVLVQLNRGDGNVGRPSLKRLRGANAIAETAQAVFLLHREDIQKDDERLRRYRGEEDPSPSDDAEPVPIDVICDKNRQGPKGTDAMLFYGHTTSFTEIRQR